MGNITNICSCIYLNQDKKNSNIKINSFNVPYPNHLHMKPSDNTVNMVESTDASLLSNILQTSEQFPEPKMHFIESYNSKNNFFYYLSKIKTIQRFYKKRFQFKQTLKLPLKTQKTVKQIFIADIDNEGEERVIDSEEIEVGAFNKFNYEEFQHHISCMDNIMKLSLITENDFDQVLTPKVALKAKPEGIMKKKTKDFVRAIVKRQTVNKKNQLTIPNQEECSLTNYITTCQASFKSINKLTIINDPNVDKIFQSESRGCFLKKKLKFKFEGNVSVETHKKEGFGKITWNDESFLLVNFKNNRANHIGYYNDKPNCSEFSGYYEDNYPNGYGLFKSEGIITEGEWNKNILTGIGREYSDKDTYYQGEYTNCVKNGIGIYRWKDGTMYKGEWINNQMTGFGIISYNDDKLYLGQINNGLMNGYGEFYWGKEEKKYMGYYKNDLKHGFGIYISSKEENKTYIGFWEKGKMHGVGLIIRANKFKYGIWKNGINEKWLQGPWELRKYVTNKNDGYNFVKILELTQDKLTKYLVHLSSEK